MVAKRNALLGCVCFMVAINSMEKINKSVLAADWLWQQRNAEKKAPMLGLRCRMWPADQTKSTFLSWFPRLILA